MPFDHFNVIAGFYDRGAKFSLAEPLQRLLALTGENRLLDAGGGTGRVASAIRDRVQTAVIVDSSMGMLRRAVEKELTCVNGLLESLPFLAGAFDRIIMQDAFHHVRDQRRTARELWRVLEPGGKILIVEPDIRKVSVKFLALMEKILLMRSHFLNGKRIAALFENRAALVSVLYSDLNVYVVVERVRQM